MQAVRRYLSVYNILMLIIPMCAQKTIAASLVSYSRTAIAISSVIDRAIADRIVK